MQTNEFIAHFDSYVMGTYNRLPLVLVRGEGARVWDRDGNEYLDFLAGIAVCSLGHCHPRVVDSIQKQAERLNHVSNIFYNEPQAGLAQLLVDNSFADKAFFCNSGAEANEAAIKLARRYAYENKPGQSPEIITMKNSFHGRTLTTVTATGQEKFQVGFEPLPPGFCYVQYDDLADLEGAITEQTCAVMVEPIQGEGGVRVPDSGYLQGLRTICDDHDLLLILDEVQVGVGRTGSLFAYEESGITPDIVTLAKALGNGFPVGAMLATDRVASVFVPGTHASTFGGNPLAMAAGIAVIKSILNDGVLENCRNVGIYFREQLCGLAAKHSIIEEVRGKGLMIGVEISSDGNGIVKSAMKKGLLLNCAGGNVLRFVPPLIITEKDVDEAIQILDEVMGDV